MEAYRWWFSRLGRYNLWVALSGICAASASAAIISAVPDALPEAEITIFAIAFQGAAYLAVMGIANLIILLSGPALEKMIRPALQEVFRARLFRVVFWCSCAMPFLIPLALLIKALGSPASPSSIEGY